MVVISVAFDIAGRGAAARLRVDRGGPTPSLLSVRNVGNLHYDGANLKDDPAINSLADAQAYVSRVIGWPPRDTHLVLSFERLDAPPSIIGGSLFGAFCLALMRAVTDLDTCHPWSRSTVVPYVRAAALDRVGISAGCDDETKSRFCEVGRIEEKLTAFATMHVDHFAIAVVTTKQTIGGETTRTPRAGDIHNIVEIQQAHVPVLEASDPVDAFKQLCALQARATLASV